MANTELKACITELSALIETGQGNGHKYALLDANGEALHFITGHIIKMDPTSDEFKEVMDLMHPMAFGMLQGFSKGMQEGMDHVARTGQASVQHFNDNSRPWQEGELPEGFKKKATTKYH